MEKLPRLRKIEFQEIKHWITERSVVGRIANLSSRELTNYGMHFFCRTLLPAMAIFNGTHVESTNSMVLLGSGLFGGAFSAAILSESVCERIWSPEVQGLRLLTRENEIKGRVGKRVLASLVQKGGHLAWEAGVSGGAWLMGPEFAFPRLLGTSLGLLVESGYNLINEVLRRKRGL